MTLFLYLHNIIEETKGYIAKPTYKPTALGQSS